MRLGSSCGVLAAVSGTLLLSGSLHAQVPRPPAPDAPAAEVAPVAEAQRPEPVAPPPAPPAPAAPVESPAPATPAAAAAPSLAPTPAAAAAPTPTPLAADASVQAPPALEVSSPDEEDEDDDDASRRGFFRRLSVGLGVASVSGDLPPKPGFKPIYDLEHVAPVFALSVAVGGGGGDFALALELSYEQLLRQVQEPSRVGFKLFGVGLSANYYLDRDWFLSGHLRWVAMIPYLPDIPCVWDRFEGTGGPGFGLSLGKEWFGDGENGIGLALQGNFARLQGTPELSYASGLLLLTLSRF